MTDIKDVVQTKKHESAEAELTDAASIAVQRIIQKYTLEAVWPSKDPAVVKSLIMRMASDMARLFGRKVEDVSLEDLARAQAKIQKICGSLGVHRVRYGTFKSAAQMYQSAQTVIDFVSHVYWIGNLFFGNFGPVVRKLGLKVGGAPLARAAGVWLSGQALSELYFEPKNFKKDGTGIDQGYHPIFDSFLRDQYRELALLMGIDGRVSWDEVRLRKEILGELSTSHHNKVTAMWAEIPSYHNILLLLSSELGVPQYSPTDTDEILEERIVRKVLAESVEKLSPEQLKNFDAAIQAHVRDDYVQDSVKSTLLAGGLLAGRLTGLGLYVGASSALAALGQGLGLTLALSSYTTLSAALSTVFGPVGISFAAGMAALQWTKARPKKALPFVLYIAAARGQIMAASNAKVPWYVKVARLLKRLAVRLGMK